ncbi:putative zinc finger protein [Apostichopus japonicus]|uniref:Putative zinc finger protein n=1 Tax=Stichopus japonicus TaxID=307972 RepID=A0A2G8JDS6_STIJA|nr:putative zinc finger protein [Apostichopus japonicus]
MCLWCNEKGRTFFTVDAVQRHMRDKGHCKLQCEGDATYEYSDFYDFRSSYPDREDAEEDKDGEVDDGDDSEDEIEIVSLNQDGYELVLPSGARIGHRELMRYYNQNLPPRERGRSEKLTVDEEIEALLQSHRMDRTLRWRVCQTSQGYEGHPEVQRQAQAQGTNQGQWNAEAFQTSSDILAPQGNYQGVCITCPCFLLFTSIGTFIKAKFSVTDEFFSLFIFRVAMDVVFTTEL